MQKSLWEYCSTNSDQLASEIEEFQQQVNSQWCKNSDETTNQGAAKSDELPTSFQTNDQSNNPMLRLQQLLEASDQSCRLSLESLDNLLTTIHHIKTSYYDVTSRTNSLMSKCESLLEEQHTLQHTVEILRKTLKPFQDIEDVARILGIPYDSIHQNHGNSSPLTPSSSSSSALTSSSSTLSQHLDPRSSEFKELLLKLSNAVIFLQNHPDIMENQKYTQWLEKLQIRAISLIGRAMRELIDKTAKQCRELIQQKLYFSPNHHHHPTNTNSGSNNTNNNNNNNNHAGQLTGNSRLYTEELPIESLPIYQKFRGLSFRMKELVGVLLRGYLSSVITDESNNSNSHNTEGEYRLRASSNASTYGGGNGTTASTAALAKYFQHLAKHDYAVLAEVKKSYALIRMELIQPFLQEAFLVTLASASSSFSFHGSHSGTNFSSIIEEKRSKLSNTNNNSNPTKETEEKKKSSEYYLSLSTVIRQSFSTLLRIAQLEFHLFDSLFNIDHIHHVSPLTGMMRSLSMESTSTETIGLTLNPTPGSTPRSVTARPPLHSSSSSALTKKGKSGSGQPDDPASIFASDLNRVVEYASNSTRDFLRPLIIRESSVDELCRVISILSEDIKSQINVLQIPLILVKQLNTGLENVMNDSKERLIYCAETKLRQEVQFYEPLPSHLAYPEILETFEKRQQPQRRTPSSDAVTVTTTSTFPTSNLVIEDVYDTWYPPMRLTLSLLSKLYGIIDNLIFEDFARRCIEISILILSQGSEQIKRQQKTMMIHGDLFLVRHLLILREQLIPFEVKLQSSEKVLDFTNTRVAFQQFLTNSADSTTSNTSSQTNTSAGSPNNRALVTTNPNNNGTGGNNPNNSNNNFLNNRFLRFDENNLFFQFAKSGIPLMKEFHYDMKKELDNSLKKACISLKGTANKFLLGPLENLLAKAVAFIGEIPYQQSSSLSSSSASSSNQGNDGNGNGKQPQQSASGKITNVNQNNNTLLSIQQINSLKSQSFLRYERIKESYDQLQHLLLQRIPDLKNMMKLYIENATTRNVLMKSILQEFEISKLKMDCIVSSCVEAVPQQKELESSLQMIYRKIVNEFSNI